MCHNSALSDAVAGLATAHQIRAASRRWGIRVSSFLASTHVNILASQGCG